MTASFDEARSVFLQAEFSAFVLWSFCQKKERKKKKKKCPAEIQSNGNTRAKNKDCQEKCRGKKGTQFLRPVNHAGCTRAKPKAKFFEKRNKK